LLEIVAILTEHAVEGLICPNQLKVDRAFSNALDLLKDAKTLILELKRHSQCKVDTSGRRFLPILLRSIFATLKTGDWTKFFAIVFLASRNLLFLFLFPSHIRD
jgi:hypothetical protein